ncbi:MAG: cysteine desulfurase family protein [Bryobacteraceae bacterium]
MSRFYFDHNATTPVSPASGEALAAALCEVWGNASSVHREGQAARHRLEAARAAVATLIGAGHKEIVFTSGGTESANLALLGYVRAVERPRRHIVTTAIEHPAVLNAAMQLEREGVAVTVVSPDANGLVDPASIRDAISPDTVLISVMHANNETGVIQPISEIARIAQGNGIAVHSDGVQAAGKTLVDVAALGVDLYSISGHKFYAPKGIGALFVREGVRLQPLQWGGRHERSRRAGTENVPGAIAMGVAAATVDASDNVRIAHLRDRLEEAVLHRIPDTAINGAGPRLPNTANFRFHGIEGEAAVIALDLKGFAVSSGSACSSGAVEPSHVLLAMGQAPEQARSSVRISLGAGNTADQVDRLVDALVTAVAHLRRLSPAYAHA